MSGRSIGRRDAVLGTLAALVVGTTTGQPAEASTVVDDGELEALMVFRRLSPSEKKAAIRMAERLVAGEPIRTAGVAFLTECGWDQDEAERLISNLPTDARGDG